MAKKTSSRSYTFNIDLNAQLKAENSQLKQQLASANSDIEYTEGLLRDAQEQVVELNRRIAEIGKQSGLTALKEQLNEVRSTTALAAKEFEMMLKASNMVDSKINLKDSTDDSLRVFRELQTNVEKGSMTVQQAMVKVKQSVGSMMGDIGSSGGSFDSQMLQNLTLTLEKLSASADTILSKVNAIQSGGVKVSGEVGSAGESATAVFQRLTEAASQMDGEMRSSYESIAKLAEALTAYSAVDEGKLLSISNTFKNMASLNDGTFGAKSVENMLALVRKLQAMSSDGSNQITFRIRGLEGFKDLKVSKTPLNNIVNFVNSISNDADIGKLQSLAAINWDNLTNLKFSKSSATNLASLAELSKTIEEVKSKVEQLSIAEEKAARASGSAKSPTAISGAASGDIGKMTKQVEQYTTSLENASKVQETYVNDLEKTKTVISRERGVDSDKLVEVGRSITTTYESAAQAAKRLAAEEAAQARMAEDVAKKVAAAEAQTAKERAAAAKQAAAEDAAQAKMAEDVAKKVAAAQAQAEKEKAAAAKQAAAEDAAQAKMAEDTVKKVAAAQAQAEKERLAASKQAAAEEAAQARMAEENVRQVAALEKQAAKEQAAAAKQAAAEDAAQAKMAEEAAKRAAEARKREAAEEQEVYKQAMETVRLVEQAEKEAAQAEREAAQAKKQKDQEESQLIGLEKQRVQAVNQLQAALRNASAAENSNNQSSREAYKTLKSQQQALDQLGNDYRNKKISVDDFKNSLNQIKTEMASSVGIIKQNGDYTKTWSDRISGLAQKFSAWLSVSQAIMFAINGMRQMVSASIELDSAMTDLKIVTGETDATYRQFASDISQTAQDMGVAIKDLIDATTTYSRLGYSLQDAQKLAEYTGKLQVVGDIEASDAQDSITAMLKAFKDVDISNIESVMDKLVVVGNGAPVSVSQIAEAMNNASSALSAAGNSFEESVALITAANTTIEFCRAA